MSNAMGADRTRYIFKKSEDLFKSLCTNSNMVATKPDEDLNGWDYFVEFPQNRENLVALDSQKPPVKFFCQVKSTDIQKFSIDFKLSNLEHFAKTPFPCFVFVVEFHGEDDPQNIYLCHFDDQRVSQCLEKLRIAEASGKVLLHKQTTGFVYTHDERVNFSKRGDLARKIYHYTGSDLSAYTERKSFSIKTVGYNGSNYKLSFSLRRNIDDVINSILSDKEIDVEDVAVHSTRFGIDLLDNKFSSAKLKISPIPAGSCTIVAISRRATIRSEIEASVFFPSLPNIPVENMKMSVKADSLEALIDSTGCNIDFNFDTKRAYKLNYLINFVKFLICCNQSDCRISFERKRVPFASIDTAQAVTLDQAYDVLLSRLNTVRSFLDLCGYRDDVDINPNDVFTQNKNFSWLKLATSQNTWNINSDIEANPALNLVDRKGMFATPILFNFCERRFLAFCYWSGKFEIIENRISAKVKNLSVWRSIFVEDLQNDAVKNFEMEFEKFCREITKGIIMSKELVYTDD